MQKQNGDQHKIQRCDWLKLCSNGLMHNDEAAEIHLTVEFNHIRRVFFILKKY
jgi:hypothetical protein